MRAIHLLIEKKVYLILNSLWDWEPVERLKQRNDVVSFTWFSEGGRVLLFFQNEASGTVLRDCHCGRKFSDSLDSWTEKG